MILKLYKIFIYKIIITSSTGNKITSYGGNITVTQKFDVAGGRDEYSNNDDYNVLLVGNGYTIFWKNPNRLRSGTPLVSSLTTNVFLKMKHIINIFITLPSRVELLYYRTTLL